jgi:2-methylcitrate dehydratase PrpD
MKRAGFSAVIPIMKEKKPEIRSFSDGNVYCWLEQTSSVMLKSVMKSGYPVELEKNEAIELAQALLEAASRID